MKALVLPILLFLSACSNVFYQPARQHFIDPKQYKLDLRDVYFKSRDGTRLHGWHFPTKAKTKKGTVVQFHGNAQNLSTHFFSLYWLVDHGYDLFTFDYRGFGKSEGTPSQEGVYQDALSALEKGWELHREQQGPLFVVYGQSLGGAVSLRAIPDSMHAAEIDLIVQDSTFSSYKDIAFEKLTSRWFLWPLSPLSYVLVSDAYASDEVFHKITQPTLVIVGQKDPVIPQEFGKEIYQGISPKKKWLWKLPEGSHIDAYHHGDQRYRKELLDLLDSLQLP